MPAVMQALGWKTSDGCPTCRPALNYYLVAPGPANTRRHAVALHQRAGPRQHPEGWTYSVVPRMWGGVTTPDELRAIADVADRFNIPAVKVTGGQRIDLLGVRKAGPARGLGRLNAAGMVSGFAYAKGLRTVKTCVGSEWCRFGTQDSTGLGIELEKLMWGSWTPAKVKLGGLRLPAQLRRSDRQGHRRDLRRQRLRHSRLRRRRPARPRHRLLGHVDTEEEALGTLRRHSAGLSRGGRLSRPPLQMGRQDRTGAPAQADFRRPRARKALYERFLISQRAARKDPWAERAAGKDMHEFMPLAVLGRSQIAAE